MKKILDSTREILKDIFYGIKYFIEQNLYNLCLLADISVPYVMFFLGRYLYVKRGDMAVGLELAIPVCVWFLSSLLKRISNKSNHGYQVPVYSKRFTKESEDGEVTINEDDIQEIILYLSDVENYIERRGLSKW